MSDIITNIIQDKQDIKNQLGSLPSVVSSLKRFNHVVNPTAVTTKIYKNLIGSSFIIGHPTLAQRDFTLLDVSYGPDELIYVIPKDDIHVEYFGQNDYIASVSTGVINTVSEQYTLDVSQILETEVVYKTNKNIIGVELLDMQEGIFFTEPFKFGINKFGDKFGGGNIMTKISNDVGITWETYENIYEPHYFININTDGVKIKFTAGQNFIFTQPIKIKVYTN